MQEFKYDRVHTPAARIAASETLAAQIEQYLQAGGEIEKCETRIGEPVRPKTPMQIAAEIGRKRGARNSVRARSAA